MNTSLRVILILFAAVLVTAQNAKTGKPQLGETFAKAGLKAVVVVNNAPDSERAKAAYDDAEAEHDPNNVDELIMLTNLESFKIARSGRALPPSCSIELEDAFRHRIAINLPKSCK